MALIGCGHMGRGAAYGLAIDPDLEALTLVDADQGRADAIAGWLAGYATAHVTVSTDMDAALAGLDAAALALPWSATEVALKAAAAAGVPVASITRPPYPALREVDAWAHAGGVAALLPIGLEPGLTELLAADLAERLDRAEAVEIYCGGIPRAARPPLGYVAFFGGEQADHLPIAPRDALMLAAGRVMPVARFSGVSARQVDPIGRLEAYHDGMVPWLGQHPALRHADCVQKTLRWPGFAATVNELARLGLLDPRPVGVDGVEVAPLRLVERVLAPQVRPRPDDHDVVVLEVIAHGWLGDRPATIHTRLLDAYDAATGLSAMARATGFTLAAATRLLADRSVAGAGWLVPHLALTGKPLLRMAAGLAGHGIAWSPPTVTYREVP